VCHCSTPILSGARKGPNDSNENLAALIHRIQINPFVNGVRARAVRAEGDRGDASASEKRRIHPETRADRDRRRPKDNFSLATNCPNNDFVLADAKRRPHEGCPVPRLEPRIFLGQGIQEPFDFLFYRSGVL
jgi:hypothetical protein